MCEFRAIGNDTIRYDENLAAVEGYHTSYLCGNVAQPIVSGTILCKTKKGLSNIAVKGDSTPAMSCLCMFY